MVWCVRAESICALAVVDGHTLLHDHPQCVHILIKARGQVWADTTSKQQTPTSRNIAPPLVATVSASRYDLDSPKAHIRQASHLSSTSGEDSFALHALDSTRAIRVFMSLSRHTFMATQPPTLSEILLGVTPPPWTLAAFKAYLFENHCIETIQFTFDCQHYASVYDQFVAGRVTSRESQERVCGSWEMLMQTYITPCAPCEVNLSSRDRHRLLDISCRPLPPPPQELEDAMRSIFKLMNESLFVPFLQSVGPG